MNSNNGPVADRFDSDVALARLESAIGRRLLVFFLYSLPVLVVGGLLITYLVSPRAYLDYVIHPKYRENQLLENATFGAALLGGVILFGAAWALWNRRFHGGAVVVGLVAAAALFFAGEEISWGQNFIGKNWSTPEALKSFSRETNLHNSGLPVRPLGNVFLVAVFFVLPLGWRFRGRLQLPQSLAPAVAEGPVVSMLAFAFVWRVAKDAYELAAKKVSAQWTPESDRFYVGFVEQLNEQKELLVAATLLLYALYRLRRLRMPARSP
jgi:hypothetical protein